MSQRPHTSIPPFSKALDSLPSGSTDPVVVRSWQRCLEHYQLDPASPQAPCVIEQPRLIDHREPLCNLLGLARGQMNTLYQQLGGAGHTILLTDAQGVVIESVFHEAEQTLLERAGLWLGAVWNEDIEGTNGVGTCLVERQPITIFREEHFRSRHTGLTCSAMPVFDPAGNLQAVLNVSTVREQQSRQSQFHTMALTTLSAKLIENGFFLQHCKQDYLLRFHTQPEFLGLLSEGLLAFDGGGRITAVNEPALNLLATRREALLGQSLEGVLDIRLDELLAYAQPQPSTYWSICTLSGVLLHAQVRGIQLRTVVTPPPVRRAKIEGLCLADHALHAAFDRALKVLEHDVPVLLYGETGTGKEAFATALHRASSRAGKPFIALNCAAIPEALIESELFGYCGGTFTGARKEGMAGKLQHANGGVLFLDEIGDMPLALQTRLLRVLEERHVVPLGSTTPQPLDIRLISASHRDLKAMVAAGQFREDLYYRLTGLQVTLTPLRERSDKAELIDHLLREEARGKEIRVEPAARQALLAQPWPGNIRQLRNLLRTLVALSEGCWIGLRDVAAVLPLETPAENACNPLGAAERDALVAALQAEHWHRGHVAERLGISRNTLYRKLRKHGLINR
ncbi:sigma-54-dependent Fis family transcriptional regulator [Pseudomonas sp. LTJR-52]|uniref:sigma-54-dependent Fis family transcriptional regulator n=1 Tax=Pseudomonas sp. LTJR-52 TaxID=2479392 RepID=UPI001C49A5C2|nr:sigma-54-dependent Fis family transcriptional regulator [Pseudomonas sp. LTJR-52]